MLYDYLIIGSGMGGLSAGLNLAKNKKKVLILEKNSLPGGLVTTFKRGRFEFDTSIYYLFDYGNDTNQGKLAKLLKENDIELNTKVVDFNMQILDLKTKDKINVKGDFETFRIELEKLKIDSTPSINKLLDIIKEIHTALDCYLNNDEAYTKYPNFLKYLDKFTDVALKDIGIPNATINRLCYIWVLIGTPIYKLSFIDFCDIMYKIIYTKQVISLDKALDFPLKLVNKYETLGGKILYNSQVTNIRMENNIYFIKTKDNLEYKTKHIIGDISPRYFYHEIFKEPTKEQLKLDNARSLSVNTFVVYLGLNRACYNLGLNNYHYYLFDDIRSDYNIKNMTMLNHHTMEAIVPNVINETASPKNTTILILKKTFYQRDFPELTKNNYLKFKLDVAQKMINDFEKYFNLDISEYIEEIEVATPKTFRSYTNSPNGAMFGYSRSSYDNMIHRVISYDDEKTPNISFVGANSVFGGFINNAFLSGYYVTNKLLEKEVNHD